MKRAGYTVTALLLCCSLLFPLTSCTNRAESNPKKGVVSLNRRVDAFAHVLLPDYYGRMLAIDPTIPEQYSFVNIPSLKDMKTRRANWNGSTQQIISFANINAEDYTDPEQALSLCKLGNEELIRCVKENRDMFPYGVAMVPMNNIEGTLELLETIADSEELVGIQLFTRHLGKSIADPEFRPVLQKCAELGLPIFLHPVFDERKPDNNLVFSWEYELSQAMMQLVQADIFRDFPEIKIVVHHAGAMVPYFAGRIENILPDYKDDFKKFYVDTALLGNSKALELAVEYFGVDHVLYGTDAPFGVMPAGAVTEIEEAVEELPLSKAEKEKIFSGNFKTLIGV